MMVKVILESPFAGDIERNIQYARECTRDSLLKNEAPIVSHLLYTQEGILNDDIPEEREQGINAGLVWMEVADKHVFYIDYGMSNGMLAAEKRAIESNSIIEYRRIKGEK